MKIYLVGGAVRDQLLGLPVKERDYVVVGASSKDMLEAGYFQVGKDFPVFLHPKTGEEYALARMERKIKPGYKGFTVESNPSVTLEDDLIRRDLTINAMAEAPDGSIIDPHGGRNDLDAKLLRHVSPAFTEDPVRILRIGRFLARFAHLGFSIAPDTFELMREMVKAGEVNALVAERVWKEFERALSENQPAAFFYVLQECNALPILFPGLGLHSYGMTALQESTKLSTKPSIRLAALLHDLQGGKPAIAALCRRYRIPNAPRELATMTAVHYTSFLKLTEMKPSVLLDLFYILDIFRREERFHDFLITMQAIATAHQQSFPANWVHDAAHAVKEGDVQKVVTAGYTGYDLAKQLKLMRLDALDNWIKNNPVKTE